MKARINKDKVLVWAAVFLTLVLFSVKQVYVGGKSVDNSLDCFAIILILAGNCLRMSARGYKKRLLKEKRQLVTTGICGVVRNPMCLGSYLIGAGFMLLVWPWWLYPVYAFGFKIRFRNQIREEEDLWKKNYPDEFEKYEKRVPEFWPQGEALRKTQIDDVFSVRDALETKEVRSLYLWPLFAFILESIQEWIVFGNTNILETALILTTVSVIYFLALWLALKVK